MFLSEIIIIPFTFTLSKGRDAVPIHSYKARGSRSIRQHSLSLPLVKLDRNGRVVNFKVERLKQVPKDNFPTKEVYDMTSSPTLRLVTGGKFNRSSGHYLDNVIVFASVVEN